MNDIADMDDLIRTRTEAARADWLTQQVGKVPRPISAINVDAIAQLLGAHGVPPTARAIREVHGSGSFNVITPFLRNAWISGSLQRGLASKADNTAEAVPARLLALWDQLVAESTSVAKRRLDDRQQILDSRSTSLDDQMDALLQREVLMDERAASLQTQLQMAEASAADSRAAAVESARDRDASLNALALAREGHAQDREALLAREARALAEASQVRETLARRDGELTAMRVDRDAMAVRIGDLSNGIAEATMREEQATQRADRAMQQAEQATQRADRLILERASIDMDLASLRTDLALSNAREKAARDRADTLEGLHSGASSELATLRAAYDRRGTDIVQTQHALARLQATIQLHDQAQIDIARLRDDLKDVMRERDQLIRNPPGSLKRIESLEARIAQIDSKQK